MGYLNQGETSTTLMHQRNHKIDKQNNCEWYDRGVKVMLATKFRKGSCENCGSMSHKFKDCLERPRQKGAKFTGKYIAADDKISSVIINQYDAKRDRWNGYDSAHYSKIIETYEKIEDYRRVNMQKNNNTKHLINPINLDDDVRIDDNEQLSFDKLEKRVNTVAGGSTGTIRNLRIREDTAKYLLNIDIASAYYDPKSRSMREDPNHDKPDCDKYYAGDNLNKTSGKEYEEFIKLQLYQLCEKRTNIDTYTDTTPSQLEALLHEFQTHKKKLHSLKTVNLITAYGNKENKKRNT